MQRAVRLNPMNRKLSLSDDDVQAVQASIADILIHEHYGSLEQPIPLERILELASMAKRDTGGVRRGIQSLCNDIGLITVTGEDIFLTDAFKCRFIIVDD